MICLFWGCDVAIEMEKVITVLLWVILLGGIAYSCLGCNVVAGGGDSEWGVFFSTDTKLGFYQDIEKADETWWKLSFEPMVMEKVFGIDLQNGQSVEPIVKTSDD